MLRVISVYCGVADRLRNSVYKGFLLRSEFTDISVRRSHISLVAMASGQDIAPQGRSAQGPITIPSPLPEPMTPRTSWMDVCLLFTTSRYFRELYLLYMQLQTPGSNPPSSALMPPPSAPPSHILPSPSLGGPSPSPGPSSLASSSYPSSASPMSPHTPGSMLTPESIGIVPQLQ